MMLQNTINKESSIILPGFSELCHEVTLYHNDPDLNCIMSEVFQANPIIVKRIIDNLSHLIWSSDSDFVIHNPNAVLMRDYKYSRSSGTPYHIVLWAGDTDIAEEISILLNRRFLVLKRKTTHF